jgi:hypothetical protein
MNKSIENIIKNKKRLIIVSPHLDDAVFSIGGILLQLQGKIEIIALNVFTKSSKPYTLSAKKHVIQCGFKNAEKLYNERIKEDKLAFKKIEIYPIYLNFEDALFRKIDKLNIIRQILGKIIPELIHVYPIYRLSIINKVISKYDAQIINKIKYKIQSFKLSEKDLIFCPLGIGSHVDHLVVKKACEELKMPKNLFFWADIPYACKKESNNELERLSNNIVLNLEPNYTKKLALSKIYKTQYKSVIVSKKYLQFDESLYNFD